MKKTQSRKPLDAIALLKVDHADVKRMYAQFEALVESDASTSSRRSLAERICLALDTHATLEEEIFYPAVRKIIDDVGILVHAKVEHEVAKDLIGQVRKLAPDDARYDPTVCVLCEYVAHHVKEEEREMFPKVRAGGLDLVALAQKMMKRRDELVAEAIGANGS